MVYTRKRKRSTYRTKRRFTKRYKRRPNSKKLIAGKTYHWKRVFDNVGSGTVSGSGLHPRITTVAAGTTVLGGISFLFGYIRNFTEFTALFKFYRINCVVVKVRAFTSPDNTVTAGDSNPLIMDMAYDQENSSAPGAKEQLRDYTTYRQITLPYNKWVKFKCYPRCANTIFRSITSAYGPAKAWIGTGYTNVEHFGFKYAFSNFNVTDAVTVQFDYKYYFSTKQIS